MKVPFEAYALPVRRESSYTHSGGSGGGSGSSGSSNGSNRSGSSSSISSFGAELGSPAMVARIDRQLEDIKVGVGVEVKVSVAAESVSVAVGVVVVAVMIVAGRFANVASFHGRKKYRVVCAYQPAFERALSTLVVGDHAWQQWTWMLSACCQLQQQRTGQ